MKLTKQQLKQIIKEELAQILNENDDDPGAWARKPRRPPVPEDDPFARPWHSSKKSDPTEDDPFAKPSKKSDPFEKRKPDPFARPSKKGPLAGKDLYAAALKQGLTGFPDRKKHFGDVPKDVDHSTARYHGHGNPDFNEKIAYIRKIGSSSQYFIWQYEYGAST